MRGKNRVRSKKNRKKGSEMEQKLWSIQEILVESPERWDVLGRNSFNMRTAMIRAMMSRIKETVL